MKIRWYGGNRISLKGKETRVILGDIQTPNFEQVSLKEGDLVVLPYAKETYSQETQNIIEKKAGLIIDGPGEYSYQGVTIQAQSIKNNDGERQTIVSLSIEGIVIATLMNIDRELSGKELELVSSADILAVPVGGDGVLDYKKAAKLVNHIEPRIVIPIHHQIPADNGKESVETFLKEYGSSVETIEEASIKKPDLPVDRTEIYVLALSEK